MKLNSPAVEKAIRGLVREEIRSSPKLRREYERHRNVWLRILWLVTMVTIGWPLALAIFATYLGTVIGCMAIILLCLKGDPALALGALATTLAGISLLIGAIGVPWLFKSLHLRTAACFPLSDRQLFVQALKKAAVVGSSVVFVFFVAFGALAIVNRLSVWGYLLAIGSAVLQGTMFLALWLWVMVCTSKRRWPEVLACFTGPALIFGGFLGFACAGGGLQIIHAEFAAWGAFVLLPTGWIVGAFYWGVIQGQPAGWLLLAPAAMVIRAAVRWIRQGLAIEEFDLDSPDSVPLVFDRGVYSPGYLPHATPRTTRPQAHPIKEGCAEEIEQRILEGDLLRGPGKWTQEGWIERLICRTLTPREQTVMEYLVGPPPAWTLQWGAFAIVLIILEVIGIFLTVEGKGQLIILSLGLMVMAWVLSALASVLGTSRDDSLPTWGMSCNRFLPIGFLEASWATAKVAVLRCACTVPLTLGFTLIAGWYCGLPPWTSVLLGLVPLGIYLLCLPLWICWLFEPMFVIRRGPPAMLAVLFVPLLLALAFSPAFMALAAAVPAMPTLAWAYCAWVHHRR